MPKNNEFDENVDLGGVKGNEDNGGEMLDKFFDNLSDVPDSSRNRYKNEPRYKASHGETLGEYDPLTDNPGVNSDQFGIPDDHYDDTNANEKDGIFGKLLLGLAGLTVVKSLLKNNKISDMLGDKIPFLNKNKKQENGEENKGASKPQKETKLGLTGLIVMVTMSCAILYFSVAFFSQYVKNFKDPNGGFATAIEKVKNPDKEIKVFKTYIETKILPYEKKEDGIILVVLPNGEEMTLSFNTTKERGYVRVEIEKYADSHGIYMVRATKEYNSKEEETKKQKAEEKKRQKEEKKALKKLEKEKKKNGGK